MPDQSTLLELTKSRAFRRMTVEGGATPAGTAPAAEYVDALDAARDLDTVESVRQAHANDAGAPTVDPKGGVGL